MAIAYHCSRLGSCPIVYEYSGHQNLINDWLKNDYCIRFHCDDWESTICNDQIGVADWIWLILQKSSRGKLPQNRSNIELKQNSAHVFQNQKGLQRSPLLSALGLKGRPKALRDWIADSLAEGKVCKLGFGSAEWMPLRKYPEIREVCRLQKVHTAAKVKGGDLGI